MTQKQKQIKTHIYILIINLGDLCMGNCGQSIDTSEILFYTY